MNREFCMSAGKDGSIAEYDMEKLSPARGVRLASLHFLASPDALTVGASPTALTFAPPLPKSTQSSSNTMLLVADEALKFRLYNADTHECVSTVVGPLHGGPVNSCRIFRYRTFPSATLLLWRLSLTLDPKYKPGHHCHFVHLPYAKS